MEIFAAQFLAGFVQMLRTRSGNDDLSSSFTEGACHFQTEAPRASGDQCTASGEIESVENWHGSLGFQSSEHAVAVLIQHSNGATVAGVAGGIGIRVERVVERLDVGNQGLRT